LPGIGASIGLSRILGRLFARDELVASRQTPACVLVVLDGEATRLDALKAARSLRARGIATEVADKPKPYGKQIAYAQRKGIPWVWFPVTAERAEAEVRDIRVGVQAKADASAWTPTDPRDLTVQVSRATKPPA
jgi:histidyl-tRNA synthetase